MNICMCGTQAGYPHPASCPFPLFRGTDADVERWSREAAEVGRGHVFGVWAGGVAGDDVSRVDKAREGRQS